MDENVLNLLINYGNIVFESDSSDDEILKGNAERIENFCEEIVPTFSDSQFRENFRMPISTFQKLCKDIHDLDIHICHPGRSELNMEKQVMIGLWFLGNRETVRSIAGRFGCANSTAWVVINIFSQKLLRLNVSKGIIRWPTDGEKKRTTHYLKQKYRFGGIIGAIDGSHIPIIAPINHPNSYVCRKGFHSILLQAVCNERLEFIHSYAGECGSIHDSRLLTKSNLVRQIASGEAAVNANEHLFGDSAYPLKTWLLSPFKNNGQLTEGQTTYNIVHSKCRVMIERAFGLLKGRFRRIKYLDTRDPVLAPLYIGASCILHNYILKNNPGSTDEFIEEIEDDDSDQLRYPDDVDSDTDDDLSSDIACLKRMAIVNDLF